MAKKYRVENRNEVDGYIIYIGNIEPISDRFQIRRLVIELEAEGYKQEVPFDFVNEKMRLAEGFAIGSHVHITFALRGRSKILGKGEMQGKKVWYPSLEVLNISRL